MIRNYAPQDIPAILAVIKTAFAEQKGRVNPPSSAERKTIEIIKTELETGNALVYEYNSEIIACGFYRVKNNSVYFDRLAVLPQFRRTGIGTRIIEEIESRARDLRLQKLSLSVRIELTDQQRFYRRLGYEIASYRSHQGYEDPTYVIMEKTIK